MTLFTAPLLPAPPCPDWCEYPPDHDRHPETAHEPFTGGSWDRPHGTRGTSTQPAASKSAFYSVQTGLSWTEAVTHRASRQVGPSRALT